MKKLATASGHAAAKLIDQRITELGDWRGETLSRVRGLIKQADPLVVEEWKWGVPVWSHDGIICTGETYKSAVKLTFAKGASLPDPSALFNSSLQGKTRRAIDIRAGEKLNASAFKALIKAAVALNAAGGKARSKPSRTKSAAAKPKLLSGGNPQIPKGDGDAPVKAYLDALPGWKRSAGHRLDALITSTLPNVRKAVRWNSPFYGMEGKGWCISFHAFNKYLKVVFFRGKALKPMPPVESKDPHARYVHVYEDEEFDEKQFVKWVRQAAAIPGWDGR